jgi:hypothetical protein
VLVAAAGPASGPSFTSPVGPTTFAVPAKGTAEYSDYLLMLQSSPFLKDKEGRVPYDPEWRAVSDGRRKLPPSTAEFEGGLADLTALAKRVLAAMAASDLQTLHALGVSQTEFERICWPPLPQARPYAGVPWQEAWTFQQALAATSVKHILEEFGGMQLELDSLQSGTSFDYGWYVLHSDVVIHARDRATDRVHAFRFVPEVIERHGRFKVMTYDLD